MSVDVSALRRKVDYIRREVLDVCIRAGTGHLTSSFSCAEILVALYYGGVLKYRAEEPEWEKRDRFLLSKGHASPILYAILADVGFFPKEELRRFSQADGKFGVHLQNDVPGVEITSGSLGHGFGIAVGMALAAKMDSKQYRVFTLLGDGECYEGSIWEGAMFAAHHKLNNLVAIIDRNGLCVTGFTEQIVRLDPLSEKWAVFGWETTVVDGHSFEEILSALHRLLDSELDKPKVIVANTVKGKGISFMEGQPLWHGVAPKGEDAIRARQELEVLK